MHELLERLGRGDTRLIEMCQQANHAWREFLSELHGADTGTLAARLGFFQPSIERIFESKTLGQTMMPWSAFAVLYDTQNGWGPNKDRALQLAEAFARSNCSQEARDEARSCVISYELEPARPQGNSNQRR
ncbi:MAG: hypothetical protein NT015_18280 [Alphaproteobacteria bacterium]|nr:hypothetical protein [Alphaproteobacteria bacterium]